VRSCSTTGAPRNILGGNRALAHGRRRRPATHPRCECVLAPHGCGTRLLLTEVNRGDYAVRLRRTDRRPIDEVIGQSARPHPRGACPGCGWSSYRSLQDMIAISVATRTPWRSSSSERPDSHGASRTRSQRADRRGRGYRGQLRRRDRRWADVPDGGDEQRAASSAQRPRRRSWIETALTGTVVARCWKASVIPLRLRYPDSFRERLDPLADLVLVAPGGQLAPLRSLASSAAGPVPRSGSEKTCARSCGSGPGSGSATSGR